MNRFAELLDSPVVFVRISLSKIELRHTGEIVPLSSKGKGFRYSTDETVILFPTTKAEIVIHRTEGKMP